MTRSRSRSRSPRDRLRRSRSSSRDRGGRDRARDRGSRDVRHYSSRGHKRRSRSRDHAGRLRVSRSRSRDKEPGHSRHKEKPTKVNKTKPISEAPPTDADDALMKKMMGFGGFDTTKGKHVAGADQSAVLINKKRRYRQYMNRRGGFNRPLDPIA